MRISFIVRFVAASLALMLAAHSSAATLTVNGSGILTGATGVNINGTLYNVTFQDGSCVSVFSGCDSDSDFVIAKVDTFTAAQALLDQVFTGEFDVAPDQTLGCDAPEICYILIPTHLETAQEFQPGTVFAGVAINCDAATCTDGTASTFESPSTSTTVANSADVWAVFTLAAVPEPSTWAMMALGFLAMGVAVRRGRSPVLA